MTTESETLIKKRNASLAILSTLILPGLGHLYVGKWKMALIIPVFFVILLGSMGWSGFIFSISGIIAFIVLSIIVYIVLLVDVFRATKDLSTHTLNKSQRWYLYILYTICVSFFNSTIIDYRYALFGFEPFKIPSAAMEPSIIVGDFILADTWAYKDKDPEIGDVIVFKYPRDPNIKYIKRVIGKGGDHVAMYDKVLYVNGVEIKREFIKTYQAKGQNYNFDEYLETLGQNQHHINLILTRPAIDSEYIVPEGHYFVLGDNRDNSNDSRYWGVVPQENLHGKAIYIWFSFDLETYIRNERIGLTL